MAFRPIWPRRLARIRLEIGRRLARSSHERIADGVKKLEKRRILLIRGDDFDELQADHQRIKPLPGEYSTRFGLNWALVTAEKGCRSGQRDRQKMRLMLLRTAILLLAGRARAHCVPPPDVASFLGATCTPDECVSDAFTNCTYICGEACCSKRISNESCASLRSFVTALPCSEHENCPDGQSCCNWDNTVGDFASEGTCGDVCTSSVIIAPGANAYASPFPTRSYI